MDLIMQNEHDRQQPGYVDINRQTQNIPKKGITLKINTILMNFMCLNKFI